MSAKQFDILIVDDEPLARNRLRSLCDRITGIGRVILAGGGTEALKAIEEHRPDVILLDVDMPDLSGIEVAENCRKRGRTPEIIFTTAHSGYAVKAFRLEATDYLLKPVRQALLEEALDRARAQIDGKEGRAGSEPDQRLWVQDGKTALQISVSDIERIEAERDYMRICLPGRSYLMHRPMQAVEDMLPERIFLRIHRSTMVRRDLISEFRRSARSHYVVLADGSEQRVGPSYVDRVSGAIADQAGGFGRSDTVAE